MSEDSDESVDLVAIGSPPRELEAMGYSRTTSNCSRDECDGKMWHDDHTTVCASCSTVVDTDAHMAMTLHRTVWERFSDGDRPTYQFSGRVRMAGGFGSSYDRVDLEDTFEDQQPGFGADYS